MELPRNDKEMWDMRKDKRTFWQTVFSVVVNQGKNSKHDKFFDWIEPSIRGYTYAISFLLTKLNGKQLDELMKECELDDKDS